MLSAPMLEPLGRLIVELREDATFAAWTNRVRGLEKGFGDGQQAGNFRRYVVLHWLDLPPDPDLPITDARAAARIYGTSADDASDGYGLLVKALHRKGPRVSPAGLGIYQSLVEGGAQDTDPDTHQPLVLAVIHLIAATAVIPA